jgi:molybdopterin-guanine dinucleotide biosynthesis protein A
VHRFSVAILAGGRARRLGGATKGLLDIGAQAILERQLAVLRELGFDVGADVGVTVRIIANDAALFAHTGVTVVADLVPDAGALGGLYTALASASSDPVIVLACDMPFVTAPLLLHLAEHSRDVDAVVPRDARGRHPLCAAYARRIAPYLRQRIDAGHLRVGAALDGLVVHDVGPDTLAVLDPTGRLLVNVNTPDDYEHARRQASPAR